MKFSIRDLLWLTAFAALGVCWWLDHRQLTSRIARLDYDIRLLIPAIEPNEHVRSRP
jgi:hypothetical protein